MSVDTYDCEPIAVQDQEVRRARKEHRCSACRETIRRGDLYERDFAVWGGSANVVKRCMRCEALYQELCKLHVNSDDLGVDWELRCGHTFEDVFQRPPPPELAALAFMTKDEAQSLAAALRGVGR